MKKQLIAACVIIIICSVLTVSFLLKQPSSPVDGGPQDTTQPTPQSTNQATSKSITTPISTSQPIDSTLRQAITNAVGYLKDTEDPTGLLMLNVLYRQFGIEEFSDSLERYDEILASNPDGRTRIFRRIADSNTSTVQPGDFDAVTDQLDRLTAPALHSDRRNLPDDYVAQLSDAMDNGFFYAQNNIDSGGYLLTHVLLATIWLQNNQCNLQLPEGFMGTLYQYNAAVIGDSSKVNDLQLEAAAFLYEAGQGNLVNSDFVQNVLAAQSADGGWSANQDSPQNTHWHPSVLALMILLHVAYPSSTYPPMIVP